MKKLIHLFIILALTSIKFAHADPETEFVPEVWSMHFQATTISQAHTALHAPYSGTNSLYANPEFDSSLTSTAFLGRTLWSGGQIYFNPELSGGSGFSHTQGIAAFPNGEIYRVDSPSPKFNLSRLFIKHEFGLGGERETVASDLNQIAEKVDSERLTVVAGKFSLNDYFDNNAYSHDPRTQFMSWVLMDNGAWDYAADTRGYTWGFMVEYHRPKWALRFATVMEPIRANQLEMDTNVSQAHGDNLEFEYHYSVKEHPGALRLLAYANHAHMGSYEQTLSNSVYNTDIIQTRSYRSKYGFGINLEQEVTPDLGSFMRLGWNDGATETWAFTEIDRAFSIGLSLKGTSWSRANDTLGLAAIVNGLSKAHADYLSSGGYGFIIGDGKLNYAPEQVIETYYSYQAFKALAFSVDYQFVNNPAYNADRGPVSILSARIHCQI